MIRVALIDRTSEQRLKLARLVNDVIRNDSFPSYLSSQIDAFPISIQELHFNEDPHIIVLGNSVSSEDIQYIRKLYPRAEILAESDDTSVAKLEKLISAGADDVFKFSIQPQDLIKRILSLQKGDYKNKSGKLILVDSGKGGVGITTFVSALGDFLASSDIKVAILDFDEESQDLSRFLGVRPYLNENLELILSHKRPVLPDYVFQCLQKVWDNKLLYCMTPCDLLSNSNLLDIERLISILGIIEQSFEFTIIDIGNADTKIRSLLYRLADDVLYLVSRDPALVHSSLARLKKMISQEKTSYDYQVKLIKIGSYISRLYDKMINDEVAKIFALEQVQWLHTIVPWDRNVSSWPASGFSSLKCSSRNYKNSITEIGNIYLNNKIENKNKLNINSVIRGILNPAIRLPEVSNHNPPLEIPLKGLVSPLQISS
jgi:cellulose biosynthesis protein BcsQ